MEPLERLVGTLKDRRFAVDAAVAVPLTVLAATLARMGESIVGVAWPYPGSIGLGPVWAVLLVLPLAFRRVWPVTSAVTVFCAAALHLLSGISVILPADLAVLIALYAVTVYGPRWAGWVAISAVFAGAFVFSVLVALGVGADLTTGLETVLPAAILIVVAGLAVWAFGLLRRSRELRLEALRDRADRLEREREQQAELAAAAERARIAREMHDVVAHSLSVVVAQADGGRYAASDDPDAALRALETIGETGRAALADVRRILGVLRAGGQRASDAPPAGPSPTGQPLPGSPSAAATASAATQQTPTPGPDLSPQPAAAELEPLVEQLRSTGLRISLVRLGTSRTLPPGMGLTVYRIAQEALTNVLKHAGPDANVTVLQRWESDALVLEVTDDGPSAAADDDGSGHGLVGMRERVALFGGALEVGPRPGGGFRVHAELPLPIERHDPGLAANAPSLPEHRPAP